MFKYLKESIVVGLVAGVLAIFTFWLGVDQGKEQAEPLYYCDQDGDLFMSTGSTPSTLVVALVIDPNTGSLVSCDVPGEFIEREDLTVPAPGITL